MAKVLLNIDELQIIAESVQLEFLGGDPISLQQSNQVLDAVQNVYDRLVDGLKLVSEQGQAAIARARDQVVQAWDECSLDLKNKSGEALVLFQNMVGSLINKMMEALVGSAPTNLGSNPAFAIETIKFKMSLAVSPSVGLAAQEVLRLAATSGADIEFTYKIVAADQPSKE